MNTLNVALLQMVSSGLDQDANLRKGEEFCRKAAEKKADVALFPEMWNVGYSLGELDRQKLWRKKAIDKTDGFFTHFQATARELNMAIVITYLERWNDAPRNSASVIDRHGQVILTYAKVHTCEFDLEANLTPGDNYPVAELNTVNGPVKIGVMICYDREFPESARVLMLNGAEIILTPNACGLDENRIPQFKTRAYENMVGVAMTNYASPQENGQSVAFNGMAYGEKGRVLDMLLVQAGEQEEIPIAKFDIEMLREYRKRETWGNAYRKPSSYSILTSMDVKEPFIRKDSRR
jgi:predicted amidohydrolase